MIPHFDRRSSSVLSALVLFALFISGCEEEPTSVGLSLIPAKDLPVFAVDTLYAQSSTVRATISTISTIARVPTWTPSTILVGSQGMLRALGYVRFMGFPDSMQGARITAAEMSLYDKAWYGDSLGLTVPQVALHRGRGYWLGDSLTFDSLSSQSGVYFDPTPLPAGIPTGTIDSGATTFPLDTSLVREWFSATLDTGTHNRGVVLKAEPGNAIRGFWTFATSDSKVLPKLRVQYEKDGKTGTYEHKSGFARYVADIPESDLVLDPAKIYVQTGVAYRGFFAFDSSEFPPSISVNAAFLELTLDPAASSITRFGQDSLYSFNLTSTGALSTTNLSLSARTTDSSRVVYRFGASLQVFAWLRQSAPASIVVAGLSENSTLNRFVFYGATAPEALRPRLIVTYSHITKQDKLRGDR